MTKPNLLFFLFRLHGGGAERMVSNLSTDLANRYNVKIVIFDTSEATYPFGGQLLRITLPFSGNTAGNKWWAKAIRLVMLIYKLRRLKIRHRIDVSISMGEQANIINILSGSAAKNVLSVRTLLSTQISDYNHAGVLRTLIRLLYNRAYHIVVPSKVAAQDLSTHFGVRPDKLSVIYNYIDPERIGRLALEEIADPFLREVFTHPVLLSVGRITRAKGQWLLPLLLSRLKPALPGWRLVIIGEPEEGATALQRLIRLAEELGLRVYDGATLPAAAASAAIPADPFSKSATPATSADHDIYLIGFRNNPFAFMKQSRILWFPSLFEGFPNTLLEAMQCGLPVISSDCRSGPREILSPDTDPALVSDKCEITPYGILQPPMPPVDIYAPIDEKIVDEWMKATLRLARDGELREELIRNGYRRVTDFSRQQTIREWEDIINCFP